MNVSASTSLGRQRRVDQRRSKDSWADQMGRWEAEDQCGGGRRHNGHSQLIINTLNEQQPCSRGSLWPKRRGDFPGDPKLTLVDGRGRRGFLLGERSRWLKKLQWVGEINEKWTTAAWNQAGQEGQKGEEKKRQGRACVQGAAQSPAHRVGGI